TEVGRRLRTSERIAAEGRVETAVAPAAAEGIAGGIGAALSAGGVGRASGGAAVSVAGPAGGATRAVRGRASRPANKGHAPAIAAGHHWRGRRETTVGGAVRMVGTESHEGAEPADCSGENVGVRGAGAAFSPASPDRERRGGSAIAYR